MNTGIAQMIIKDAVFFSFSTNFTKAPNVNKIAYRKIYMKKREKCAAFI